MMLFNLANSYPKLQSRDEMVLQSSGAFFMAKTMLGTKIEGYSWRGLNAGKEFPNSGIIIA